MSDRALLDLILNRRSAGALTEPGPTHEELQQILGAAGAVPDHGLLRPFRFVVASTPEGRARFGEALALTARERMPEMPESKLAKLREKANRSPTLVALVSSPKPGKIETWEQAATASCAGYAIVLAAHALGIGAVWKSVPFTRGKALSDALGLSPEEEMLGWIHLGRATRQDELEPRPPLALGEMVSVLDASGRRPLAGS
ncbi:MAG: putative nitroreductase [Labilithrix sp.]|nr:putative nitroreductase [Labilithrix sp.]